MSDILTKVPTTEEIKELKINESIKPHLRKFVIDQQREGAKKAAKEKKEEAEDLKSEEIINRATFLSKKAFMVLKLWEKIPPSIQMGWLKTGANSENQMKEQNADIGGFALYLVREYRQYLKLRTVGNGYPSPMDETNIEFFWRKCWSDMRLLIQADKNRKDAGNSSIILTN